MKKMKFGFAAFAVSALAAGTVSADVMDRPKGVQIGQRLTLMPYVDVSFGYDSNPAARHEDKGSGEFVVNPGLSLVYKAENWMLDVGAFYRFRGFSRKVHEGDSHSYGENVNWKWTDSLPNEKGWSLLFTESYQLIDQVDDMSANSSSYYSDRSEFKVAGAVERRVTDRLHVDLNTSFYMLDYDQCEDYATYYGWKRWVAGLKAGYAMSKWTDLLFAANYQHYWQDNNRDPSGRAGQFGTANRYSNESQGVTVMGGIGSYATERISYQGLLGWSAFDYGGEKSFGGFTYMLTGNWMIGETWNTSLMAQSYFQPAERDYGCANRVDMVSWGLAKSLVRGKLNANLDLAYRMESREYNDMSSLDYDEEIFSARLGLNYILNRFATLFARLEYQQAWFSGQTSYTGKKFDRDYDRFRATLGVRFTY